MLERVDRHGLGAEAAQQAVQALVQHARRAAPGRRQVPRSALEEILARVLHARRLRPGEWMSADEALIGARMGHHALGGAHIADHTLWSRAREHLAHRLS